jgi:hypothetical protein
MAKDPTWADDLLAGAKANLVDWLLHIFDNSFRKLGCLETVRSAEVRGRERGALLADCQQALRQWTGRYLT